MEEMEVDLQDYINVILKWWMVIVGVLLAALVVSAVVSFRQPPLYQASASMFEPSYQVIAGARIYSTDQTQKSYSSLAKSSILEAQVVEALGSALAPADKVPGALLSRVTVAADAQNDALFQIKVTHSDPNLAVQIANTWGSEYIEMFNELNTAAATELGFIREQLALAENDLEASEEALRAFEEESGLGLAAAQELTSASAAVIEDPYDWYGARGSELKAKNELLANHRVARDNLRLLLDLAEDARQSGRGVDDLPLELVDVPAIGGRGQLSVETILQAGEDLDAVVDLLEAEEQSLTSAISALESEVEELHAELIQDKYQHLLLSRTRDALLDRTAMLSSKAQELELQTSGVRVVSPAVGAAVVSPSPWLNVIVGGVLGLFVGVTLAFGLEYLGRARGQADR